MMETYILTKSPVKGKRFRIQMTKPKPHHHDFGSYVGKTYIDHGDDKIKQAWVARHQKDKNWDNYHSGIFMSRSLLWGPHKSLNKNIKEYERKYNVKIINKT